LINSGISIGKFAHHTVVSSEDTFLPSMDRHYCLHQPVLGVGGFKRNFRSSR